MGCTVGALAARIAHEAGIPTLPVKGLTLVGVEDAPRMIQACRKKRAQILGIEGFHLVGESIRPDMKAITDFASISSVEASVTAAIRFIDAVAAPGLLLEFTLAEGVRGDDDG